MMDSETSGRFEPDEALLESLLSMGITEVQAQEALFCTGNDSVEAAVSYVFSNLVKDASDNPETVPSTVAELGEGNILDETQAVDTCEGPDRRYKMAFVVNKSLPMGVGKVAAQVGHACLGLYRQMLKDGKMTEALDEWEYIGEKKIVLRGDSADHLELLFNQAVELNIPSYLVADAGHTQIPSGSITVLSIFGEEGDVDTITGGLSLL